MSDYHKIIQQVGGNLSQLGYDQTASISSSIPADFDANERLYAGYLMNTVGFGRLSVQAGVRFEATDATYRSGALDVSGNPTSVTGTSNYLNVLPSIQLQYRIQQDTNLRGTFGMGISRPNFSDIVPSRSIDPNTSPYPTISAGNPALKPTKANNYDILVEHYFRPYGVVQAGFFYKTLSDAIYSTRNRFTNNSTQCVQYPICDVLESINGPSGHITGFEASWEQRLAFLPEVLNGLGVALNYSYTSSQVTFPAGFNAVTPTAGDPNPPGRGDHAPLLRQAPNNYNVGLTYDKRRFSGRFAMSHNDASIYSYFWINAAPNNDPGLGLKGPNGDQYLYAHTQYDIQGSYRLYKGLSFVAYGLNLTNEVFGFYQGSKQYPIQREFYHPTFALGMKWTSGPEQ
jgi:TonB-dependent receptor